MLLSFDNNFHHLILLLGVWHSGNGITTSVKLLYVEPG